MRIALILCILSAAGCQTPERSEEEVVLTTLEYCQGSTCVYRYEDGSTMTLEHSPYEDVQAVVQDEEPEEE